MLLQNSSVWQLIELHCMQGGQTTHSPGHSSAENELQEFLYFDETIINIDIKSTTAITATAKIS